MEYLLNDVSKEQRAFLGRGWAFPPTFLQPSGTVVMVEQEEDIWQSLQILFSTTLTERVLRPDYGCNLEAYVFLPLTVSNLSYLEDQIRHNIALHEPRIRLERLDIVPDPLEGRFSIALVYLVRSTNTRFNKVFPFYKEEGTNVEL
ncbi:MAG TPA: GPW/gp25 family protein [Chitinophagaceae bacterium]|jgi:hypothetical protein|nr:GPW/gp25 family protein [Chitinophagaceae bacterium]